LAVERLSPIARVPFSFSNTKKHVNDEAETPRCTLLRQCPCRRGPTNFFFYLKMLDCHQRHCDCRTVGTGEAPGAGSVRRRLRRRRRAKPASDVPAPVLARITSTAARGLTNCVPGRGRATAVAVAVVESAVDGPRERASAGRGRSGGAGGADALPGPLDEGLRRRRARARVPDNHIQIRVHVYGH
jgi:hypothetical protein